MPVIEHDVHKTVRIEATKPYGCLNREIIEGYHAQQRTAGTDGYRPIWWLERVRIPHVMSRDCRYDLSLKDLRCTGCKHRGNGEAYDKRVRENGK